MAKILTDLEIIDIIARAPKEFDEAAQYERFITDLARVVTDHFGGQLGTVEYIGPDCFDRRLQKIEATSPQCAPTVSVAIHPDGNVPEGGGIWVGYDPDADEEFAGGEGGAEA